MTAHASTSTHARRRLGRLIVAMALTIAVCAGASADAGAALRPAGATANALLVQTVDKLYTRSGATDPRYFANDTFLSGIAICEACHLGAGTAAAVARAQDPSQPAWLDDAAIRAVNKAILVRQQPDGSFLDATVGSPSIATTFFANEVGNALLALGTRVGAADRARWVASMRAAADFLERRGELSWYSNGNLTLANAEVMELTWLVTADPRYRQLYETALAFALSPPQARWPGRGLIITKAGTRSDGADGAGYLTEQGTTLGYDPGYTLLQLDTATRLWLRARDPRVLRVMNLLTNKLLERVNSLWILNTAGGTRTTGASTPFTTGALAVLAVKGGRTDLVPKLAGQWQRIDAEVRNGWNYSHPNYYRSLAIELAPWVEGQTY